MKLFFISLLLLVCTDLQAKMMPQDFIGQPSGTVKTYEASQAIFETLSDHDRLLFDVLEQEIEHAAVPSPADFIRSRFFANEIQQAQSPRKVMCVLALVYGLNLLMPGGGTELPGRQTPFNSNTQREETVFVCQNHVQT